MNRLKDYLATLKKRGATRVLFMVNNIYMAYCASKYNSLLATFFISTCILQFVFEGFLFFHTDYYDEKTKIWADSNYHLVMVLEMILNLICLVGLLMMISTYGAEF